MNNINHHTIEVTQNDVTLVNLNSPVIDNPSNGDPENSKKDFDIDISGVTRVTSVTANDGVACSGNTAKNARVTRVTSKVILDDAINPNKTPPDDIGRIKIKLERPCFGVYDDYTEFGKSGVYYHGVKTNKAGEITETNDFICDPLHVMAGSCDSSEQNFGLMLAFKNQLGNWRKWLMPLGMLSGSCEELRAELLSQGLHINHHKRSMLPAYLQSQRPPKQLECALKVGWHDDVFVLPDRVIGRREDVFFQTDHAITAEYGRRGTLEEWKNNIARYCVGNPLLLFQVSTAFAGALLRKCHIDYAGFHVFGYSSTGKTTGHKMAGSVWGGDSFRRSWKATGNGLEAAAVLFNDGLLALDEIGEADPREVNQIIYALGNGTGKQRANVKGSAKKVNKWRIVLLSNGEKTLLSLFREKGLSVKAGQEMRLLEIPVFGRFGAFDNLHDMKDGRFFSDTLQTNSLNYYGEAGITYLEKLVEDTQDFGGLLESVLNKFITDDSLSGQEKRAARAFALVALAGELATSYGVTGWSEGNALDAALECFSQWRNHRGTGATEDRVILWSIKDYIDTYLDSRFTDKNVYPTATTKVERSGWYSIDNGQVTYLFTPAGLANATTGYDRKHVVDALIKAKWLTCDKSGKTSIQYKIDGVNKRLYTITIPDDDTLT